MYSLQVELKKCAGITLSTNAALWLENKALASSTTPQSSFYHISSMRPWPSVTIRNHLPLSCHLQLLLVLSAWAFSYFLSIRFWFVCFSLWQDFRLNRYRGHLAFSLPSALPDSWKAPRYKDWLMVRYHRWNWWGHWKLSWQLISTKHILTIRFLSKPCSQLALP